jgi:hypothetical protein
VLKEVLNRKRLGCFSPKVAHPYLKSERLHPIGCSTSNGCFSESIGCSTRLIYSSEREKTNKKCLIIFTYNSPKSFFEMQILQQKVTGTTGQETTLQKLLAHPPGDLEMKKGAQSYAPVHAMRVVLMRLGVEKVCEPISDPWTEISSDLEKSSSSHDLIYPSLYR